jgi:hypothetical protein
MLAPSMFFTGFVAGFFFAAICHQNRSLIVDVNTAGLALVPIWMLGSLLFLRDMQLVLLSAAVVFLALGVGFLLVGLTAGSVVGFSMARVLTPRFLRRGKSA